jgi:hydroxymethylpyrimidine pyrophosphatase-like HAD family hydrolase
MVIGDSYNDVDMFKVAGLAVAMGNAPDAVKQAAHITIETNDEDGLARHISQKFVLVRLKSMQGSD